MGWGLCENSAVFMLTILLPSLLAIKHRSKYGVQMIGTILGVSISLTYILALSIGGMLNPMMKPIDYDVPYVEPDARTRQIECGLVIISNLFFLEAAYEDILDIKRINSHLTFIGYIKHICCCKNRHLSDV